MYYRNSSYRNRKEDSLFRILLPYIVGLLVIILLVSIPKIHTEEHIVTVTKTEIVGNNDHYMIFCKENGKTITFTLDDSFWYGQWNTADIYAEIEEGHTYKVKVTGFRIPFFSMYQNIVDIKEVK